MFTDVTIEELRGVGRVELRLEPDQRVYTFFGSNGVGKTKCLEALYQFLLASNKDFQDQFLVVSSKDFKDYGEPLRRQTYLRDDEGEVISFEDNNVSFKNLIIHGKKFSDFPHQFPVVFIGANRPARLKNNINAHDDKPLGKFESRRNDYFNEFIENFDSDDLGSQGMGLGDTQAWFVKLAQSTHRFLESKDNRLVEIEAVLSMLNEIDNRIDGSLDSLIIDGDNGVHLNINGERRELGQLSSGFAALVKIAQTIISGYAAFTNETQLRNVRGIVLIDEIDAHLHAEWQVRIIPCLKKLLPNTTFIVATHSPLVLVRLKQQEAYLLKRDDDGVVRSQTIQHPNRRLFVDVLDDGFGVDLNKLKLDGLVDDDQSDLKAHLLSLLKAQKEEAV